MSARRNFTEQDYELLSAYLDGALPPTERTALETRLGADDGLRQELEALRQTVTLIGNLPARTAPRDFTLTPAMVRPARWLIFPTSAAFSGVAAAAATILILVGAGLLFLRSSSMTSAPSPMQPALQQESQAEVALVITETALPSAKAGEETDEIATRSNEMTLDGLFYLPTTASAVPYSTGDGSLAESEAGFAAPAMSNAQEPQEATTAIPAFEIAAPTVESNIGRDGDLTMQTGVQMGATFAAQGTLPQPVAPPVAADSAAQVGGNSLPADDAGAGAAMMADQAIVTVTGTPAATFNREMQPDLTTTADAARASLPTPTMQPTATASPTPTTASSPTPAATQTQDARDRASDAFAVEPVDLAPVILFLGVLFLAVAAVTTIIRRRRR